MSSFLLHIKFKVGYLWAGSDLYRLGFRVLVLRVFHMVLPPRCMVAGFFLEPTVFVDVEDNMYVAKEESFGPIMLISKFKDG